MILVNSVESITLPKFPNVNLDVWIENKHSYFVGGPQIMVDVFHAHGSDPYG
jgi:hypothetical protein